MFQPLEVTEARTLWIDSPSTERLGFQDSSRVQIDRDSVGTGDFTETGDGFKAKLLGGMWPDDDELRLLVVGVVPNSEQADAYLFLLVKHNTSPTDDFSDGPREMAWNILRSLVQIMPAWAGQQERTIFVSSTLSRVKPETVKTAAVNREPDRKMSFDMWRIQVDMKLVASGRPGTDELFDTKEKLAALRIDYDSGVSPTDYAHAYISVDI